MTWRLKAIALYERDGPGREVLEFETTGLTIISGNSQTGKSAVIDIINYGLMSDSCPIPKGTIRRAVAHVGLHLEGPGHEMQVIREVPAPGAKSASGTWWHQGTKLEFPSEIPEARWNKDQVKGLISDFTGITGADVLSNPSESDIDLSFAANIRHAAPLMFQPQDIIANRHVSFPGLDRDSHRRHMMDALPFLLGIEDAETLSQRSELRKLKVEQRRRQMQGLERKRVRADAFGRGYRLWTICAAKGLLDGEPPEDVPSLLQFLSDITIDEQKRFDLATAVPNIAALERDEQQAREALTDSRRRIRELAAFEHATAIHQKTVDKQLEKLSVAELLPEAHSSEACPVCGTGTYDSEAESQKLQALVTQLSHIKAIPLRIDYSARKARVKLEAAEGELKDRHKAAKARLKGALDTVSKNAKQLQESRAIDVLLGQVKEYLDSVRTTDLLPPEYNDDLEKQIEDIQKKLEAASYRRRKIEDSVAHEMTQLARQMDTEFEKGQAKLKLDDLSIKVQIDPTSDDLTPLSEIGSGANWVSYHIAAIMALHSHLSSKSCPVPRLIILDQPSQAWFPRLVAADGEEDDETGEERIPQRQEDVQRVLAIFKLLREYAAREGFSQVIVLDHAYFKDDWFERAVLRDWRGGKKLVPPHWDKGMPEPPVGPSA